MQRFVFGEFYIAFQKSMLGVTCKIEVINISIFIFNGNDLGSHILVLHAKQYTLNQESSTSTWDNLVFAL